MYIVLVSVIGLAVEGIVSRPLPAELGGTNPFAHVLMMGAVCYAALVLLRHVKADVSGRPGGRGLLGRAADVAVGAGMRAGVGGAGAAALGGLRGLRSRSGSHRPTPWEQIDAAVADAQEVLGAPRSGFEPVPTDLRRRHRCHTGRRRCRRRRRQRRFRAGIYGARARPAAGDLIGVAGGDRHADPALAARAAPPRRGGPADAIHRWMIRRAPALPNTGAGSRLSASAATDGRRRVDPITHAGRQR